MGTVWRELCLDMQWSRNDYCIVEWTIGEFLERVHVKTWKRHRSWQWKLGFLASKRVTKFDKQSKFLVTVKSQGMLTPASNYRKLRSASPFFRLSDCMHTANIHFSSRDPSNDPLGTIQCTWNTQNTEFIHRNSIQREEKQFIARVVHPTAKHREAHQCFASCPMHGRSLLLNAQQNARHVDVAQKGWTTTMHKDNMTILQSRVNPCMYQWAFGRGLLHRVNHHLHMYQWAHWARIAVQENDLEESGTI